MKKIENTDKQIKSFTMKIPKDSWKFLKMMAIEKECSMMDTFVICVDSYRKKVEGKLKREEMAS